MIKITNKANCCGCHACFNICPKNAIEMIEDEKGFLYPVIDKDKCIDCGACERVCPVLNKNKKSNKPEAYACINKNKEILLESSSGGIFTLIAETILDMNGVVFGAQFNENFDVVHSFVKDSKELYKLRGSKYVQSTIGNTYKKVKEFLEKGKVVLFTGTPCQIEGLFSFLGKDYENLYTQDIICHGVPSPKVWRKYKEYIEQIKKSKIKEVNFRDKTNGWSKFSLKFNLDNNKKINEIHSKNKYMLFFLQNLILRESCYECNFKSKNRKSDITLADFWGIKHVNKKMYNNNGVSLVIVNSLKGKELFEKIENKMTFIEVNLDETIKKYNMTMISSVEKNKFRNEFFEQLNNLNFDELMNKYIKKTSIINKIDDKLKISITNIFHYNKHTNNKENEKCKNLGTLERERERERERESYIYKKQAYACINKDKEVVLNSSSGGIFTLIAETILDMNGVVFGAQFDENFNVVHSFIEDSKELYKYRGSKYVQSTIGNTYKKVKEFLENGKLVLFTGTPCQIEGLYSFLGKDYENLYTQDIICHGVPSPKVWRKYKDYIEKVCNSKIKEIKFRDKKYGWENWSIKYKLENKEKYNEMHNKNEYTKIFLSNVALRDSCYTCNFREINRKADVTLADFWGVQKISPKMYDKNGVSLVILNTEKGKLLFEKIKNEIIYELVKFNQAIKYNSSFIKSPNIPKNRDRFFEDLGSYDFDKLVDKYVKKPKFSVRLKNKIKSLIK